MTGKRSIGDGMKNGMYSQVSPREEEELKLGLLSS
jgi:hypothetical protein